MQQLHQHKAHRIVHTRPETRPEGRQRQGVQTKLDQRGESNHQPAARCLVDHGAVFGWRAGDVVLARFCAALGHLGRDQRGVGGEQRAQTAPLLAHLHQRRHQLGGRRGGLGRQQAVEQQPHAHDAFAQLAQAEHQPDGDAVVFKVRVTVAVAARQASAARAGAGGFVEPVGVRKACSTSTRRLSTSRISAWKGWASRASSLMRRRSSGANRSRGFAPRSR